MNAKTTRLLRRAHAIQLEAGTAAIDEKGGDLGGGILRGVAVISVGGAEGHDLRADVITLDMLHALAGEDPAGVQVHLTHAHASARAGYDHQNDGFGWYVGRLKNWRRTGDVLRADLHLDIAADASFRGTLRTNVLARAKSDPGSFGLSVAMKSWDETVPGEEDMLPAMRPSALISVDIVGNPAMNDQLFSAKEETMKDETAKDPRDALLAEMSTKLSAIETRTAKAEAENVVLAAKLADVEKARATEAEARLLAERTSMRTKLDAEFDSALREGRVYPAERAHWLGVYEPDGKPKLLTTGQPENLGEAVQRPEAFRAWLKLQPVKHSQPISGGSGVPPQSGDAMGTYFAALDEAKIALAAGGMSGQTLDIEAQQLVARQRPDIYRAYRMAIPGRQHQGGVA